MSGDLGLSVWSDNHACNMPGCACGVMDRLEDERWLALLPQPEPDLPGPLNRLQFACFKRPRLVLVGNAASDVRYWLWRLIR